MPGRDHEGKTALFGAAELGRDRVVEHLIARGADPAIQDANGKNALDAALALINSGTTAGAGPQRAQVGRS